MFKIDTQVYGDLYIRARQKVHHSGFCDSQFFFRILLELMFRYFDVVYIPTSSVRIVLFLMLMNLIMVKKK